MSAGEITIRGYQLTRWQEARSNAHMVLWHLVRRPNPMAGGRAFIAFTDYSAGSEYTSEKAVYAAFAEQFGTPKSVLYPFCGVDVTPSNVFPNVTYVDHSPEAVKTLTGLGKSVVAGDIFTYSPKERHDVLVLRGSTELQPSELEEILKLVNKGGFVIVGPGSAWVPSLRWLRDHHRIVGTVEVGEGGKATLSKDLSRLLTYYESWSEMNREDPKRLSDAFEGLQESLKAIGRDQRTYPWWRPYDQLSHLKFWLTRDFEVLKRSPGWYIFEVV